MKYNVTVNGKKYEVDVERVSPFHQMTREEIAGGYVAAPAPVAAPAAPGTAGQLKTYDVPAKTCAMLMAIVADKMGKPLNELRFISIKEVKE